ncbi:chemotaxis protein [Paenibacillus sp. FSL R7-0273]|uniref:methyl-accepting chemotaxis protein n=1 Tax=Paenibacillus sp. FSL R7-0273 TaxID=1536772 RepID=UPI0004F772C5|nr:methyl-accepting chemotaxis protein [Paenibacillus sp. FSL R7-0273]AIQ46637.1 chemotaxis protein [Paenibacillus sp. FSL R7-0273]OMF97592.1 chemotaxis protein [Paenibacillus sp. FSL R7-0273]
MKTSEILIAAMPYITQAIREDVSISLYDREKFLFFQKSEALQLDFRPGDPLNDENRDFKDLKTTEGKSYAHFPEELFGVPFDAVFIPVKDAQNEVEAVLSLTYSMGNQNQLRKLMAETEEITSRLVDSVQHVAAHSEELSSTTEEILTNTRHTVENSRQVTEVASFIREISEQSNLLGLNAAIEAARVGQAGAGFGVVATEIRKMSVHTKEATSRIELSLKAVQQSIGLMEKELTEIASSSLEQANLVNDFMDTIGQLNETNQNLKKFIKQIIDIEA